MNVMYEKANSEGGQTKEKNICVFGNNPSLIHVVLNKIYKLFFLSILLYFSCMRKGLFCS